MDLNWKICYALILRRFSRSRKEKSWFELQRVVYSTIERQQQHQQQQEKSKESETGTQSKFAHSISRKKNVNSLLFLSYGVSLFPIFRSNNLSTVIKQGSTFFLKKKEVYLKYISWRCLKPANGKEISTRARACVCEWINIHNISMRIDCSWI